VYKQWIDSNERKETNHAKPAYPFQRRLQGKVALAAMVESKTLAELSSEYMAADPV